MKRVLHVVFLITLILNISFVVLAKDRPFLLINDEFYVDAFSASTDIQEIYFEDGVLKLTFVNEGGDPTLALPIALMGDIPCDEYKVLAIKMKAPQAGNGCIYFATDTQPDLGEDKNVSTSEYVADDNWHIVTIDFSQNENYTGYVSYFRYDAYPRGVQGVLQIQWIGMFSNVQEALDYESVETTPEATEAVAPVTPVIPKDISNNNTISGNTIALIVLIAVFVISTGAAVIISIVHLKKSQNV